MLPTKPVRDILKQHCPYHITAEAIIESKHFLEAMMAYLSMEANKEFEGLNERREKLGLPRLKRLNLWSVKKASEKVLKRLEFNDTGLQSNGFVSLGGENMSADKNATKSAKEKCRDSGGENEL